MGVTSIRLNKDIEVPLEQLARKLDRSKNFPGESGDKGIRVASVDGGAPMVRHCRGARIR